MKNNWSKKPVHWEDHHNHYYSIVFTWQLFEFCKKIQPELDGKNIVIGGPAVKLIPGIVPKWVTIGKGMPVLHRHNSLATRTSIGCIRACKFCAVPKLEGKLKELDSWQIKPVIIDNNLLACSINHFDWVIDGLKKLSWCDFNQGLDARLLTKYHVDRFAELKNPMIRLAFDSTKYEKDLVRAIFLLRESGIPKKNIRVYVLIGFQDTPVDALYRLQFVRNQGLVPNPMRYQPINSLKKNVHISSGWTHKELDRYMSYWANLRFTGSIPFEEYEHNKKPIKVKELFDECN